MNTCVCVAAIKGRADHVYVHVYVRARVSTYVSSYAKTPRAQTVTIRSRRPRRTGPTPWMRPPTTSDDLCFGWRHTFVHCLGECLHRFWRASTPFMRSGLVAAPPPEDAAAAAAPSDPAASLALCLLRPAFSATPSTRKILDYRRDHFGGMGRDWELHGMCARHTGSEQHLLPRGHCDNTEAEPKYLAPTIRRKPRRDRPKSGHPGFVERV